MRHPLLLLVGIGTASLALSTQAHAQGCAEPFTHDMWQERMDQVASKVSAFDLNAAAQILVTTQKAVPCLDSIAQPGHLGRFGRQMSMIYFFKQEEFAAVSWANLQRTAAPGLEWESDGLPLTPPFQEMLEWADEPMLGGDPTASLVHPKKGAVFMNGAVLEHPQAYAEVPSLLQVVDKKGVIVQAYWQDGARFPPQLVRPSGAKPIRSAVPANFAPTSYATVSSPSDDPFGFTTFSEPAVAELPAGEQPGPTIVTPNDSSSAPESSEALPSEPAPESSEALPIEPATEPSDAASNADETPPVAQAELPPQAAPVRRAEGSAEAVAHAAEEAVADAVEEAAAAEAVADTDEEAAAAEAVADAAEEAAAAEAVADADESIVDAAVESKPQEPSDAVADASAEAPPASPTEASPLVAEPPPTAPSTDEQVAATRPTPLPDANSRRSGPSVAGLATGGGLAVVAGVLYGAAALKANKLNNTSMPYDDIVQTRSSANLMVVGSAIAGAAAVGVGVTAVISDDSKGLGVRLRW